MTVNEFIEQLAALVKKHAAKYGICVYSPIIAQGVLESARGTSELAVNANNFHGLKWRENRCPTAIGYYVKVGSEQNEDGSYTSSVMKWMKFANMEDAVIGYFDFINNANYANLKGVTDPKTYLENIKADGYATSLNYVANLMKVIESYDLTRFDEGEKTMKICIDPGHGGKENRSPGVPGYFESEMVLKLSLMQKKYLEQLGVEVVMTRTTANTNPALQSRGKASEGCDVFISNHSNAVGNGMNENIDHVAVYHLTDDNTTEADEISKELAQRLAPVIAQIMGVEDGYKVLQRKAQSDRNKDGILNDNYYGVLHGARLVNTPGLILEHGFHTHTATVMWLLDDNNLDMLARAEAQVIYEFLLELQTRIKVAQPILKQGCKGYQVGVLQENLNLVLGDDLKEKLKIDRDFGPATAAAMELFQEKYDLEQDKIYGPKSYAKMKEVLEAMAKEEVAPEEPKVETPKVDEPMQEETIQRAYCVHVGNLTKVSAEALRDKLISENYDAVVI